MTPRAWLLTAALAGGCAAISAHAQILRDYSPATVGAPPTGNVTNWTNEADSQNFAELVEFRWPAEVTAMDIFSGITVAVGESATIRVWSDFGGLPHQLLYEFTSPLSSVDEEAIGEVVGITRKHVDFSTPLTLSPFRRYWIGMSGTATAFTQMTIETPVVDDGLVAIFNARDPDGLSDLGDMAFRLFGTLSDSDGDGVANPDDNCLLAANPPQRDTDGDGIGNRCDADLDNNCLVNFADLGVLVSQLFSPGDDADLDGNGSVDFADLAIMSAAIFAKPGPSVFPNACDSPPTVTLDPLPVTPASGTVTLSAAAADDFEVLAVRFFVDDEPVGIATEAPFAIGWDTRDVLDGAYELVAEAEDAVGNVSVATPVTVEVRNGISLLWDYSPAATGAPPLGDTVNWVNRSEDINYGETVALRWPAEVTAMDIYSWEIDGAVGNSVVVRLWSDLDGLSGELLQEFTATVTRVDSDGVGAVERITRKHAEFPVALSLEPFRRYWIGMSGVGGEPGMIMGLESNPPGDARMTGFQETRPNYLQSVGDMAFRLLGAVADDDGDGIGNSDDNCLDVANAHQLDGDGDGIGNLCDADLDNDCAVSFSDLGLVTGALFTNDPAADVNGDGRVDLADVAILRASFLGKPGPSALINACDAAPAIALLEPTASPLSETVRIEADATDDFGVLAVRFRIDGEPIATLTDGPFAFDWNTRDVIDGMHVLSAEAEDAVGNVTVSAEVPVIVDNGLAALWDTSPATIGIPFFATVAFSNDSDGQNFADRVRFENASSIEAMDLYCAGFTGLIGETVSVRLWSDDNGEPGVLMQQFTETIAHVDLDGIGVLPTATRKHVEFTAPLAIPADTDIWIGMSGTEGSSLTATTWDASPTGDGQSAVFNGLTLLNLTSGDLSMRLIGSQDAARGATIPQRAESDRKCVRSFIPPPNAPRSARIMLRERRLSRCASPPGSAHTVHPR